MTTSDDLRFQMMGLGAPMAPGAASAASPAGQKDGKKDAGYPTFEAVLKDKARFEALVASAEKSMTALEVLADKGKPDQKSDARKALRAYDHAMELLKKAFELTTQIIKERQAAAKPQAAPGKK